MPQLPVVDSQRQLATGVVTAAPIVDTSRDTIGSSTLSMLAQGIGEVGKVVQAWSDANDTIQYTAAKSSYEVGMADIMSRADQDPDYNNSNQYIQEIAELKKTSTEGFTNKGLQQRVGFEFEAENQLNGMKINNLFRKKSIDYTRNVSLPKAVDALVQKKVDAVSKEDYRDADLDLQALLQFNVDSGIISQKDGVEWLSNARKTGVKYDIYNDMATEEKNSVVLAQLKKGEKGKYAFLTSKDRLMLIEDSQDRVFQNNQTFKREVSDSQQARNNILIDKMVAGEITFQDIDAELSIPEDEGGMKRKTLLTYQRAVQRGVTNDLNRMLKEKDPRKEPTKRAKLVGKYLNLVDAFIDDKTDQWKAKELLAEAWADGIINSTEQKELNTLKENMNDIKFNRDSSPVASAIRSIKSFFGAQSNPSDDALALRIKQLVGGIAAGDTPENMTKKVLTDEVKANVPDLESYPKEGKLKTDSQGNTIRIFPDGTYYEVDINKGTE